MFRIVLAATLAVAAMPFTAAPALAQPYGGGYQQAQSVRCESFNYRPARCAVDLGRGADVRIQQVLGGRCVQGDTWGWDRGGIQVSGGCRAIFAASFGGGPGYPGGPGGPGGPGAVGTVECNSWKYAYQTCALPGGGRPQLVRVIAGNCVEGQTWGGGRGQVWVDKGCRGVFLSGRGGGFPGGGNPGGGYPGGGYPGGGNPGDGVAGYVNCQSWNYAYTQCPAPGRRAQLDQVIAGDCYEGRSFGYTRGGIWVDKGCRARFAIY